MEYMPTQSLLSEAETVLANVKRDGILVVTDNEQPSVLMFDLRNSKLMDVVNDFVHTCYVITKLKQADERKQSPDAVWYEHDDFWAEVKKL